MIERGENWVIVDTQLTYLLLDERRLDLDRPELKHNPTAAFFQVEVNEKEEVLPDLYQQLKDRLPPGDSAFRRTVDAWFGAGASGPLVPLSSRGYTLGMKTAISIPDRVFRDAERLAERLKKSRSQMYSEAVAEYVARHEPDLVTEQINVVCEEVDTRPDPFVAEAARRILERTEW